MLEINSRALVSALNLLCTIEHILDSNGMKWLYKEPDRLKFINEKMDALVAELKRLGFTTAMEIAIYIKPFDEPPDFTDLNTYGQLFSSDLKDLKRTIKAELGKQVLYRLEPDEVTFVDKGENMFSEDVLKTFPKITTDLSEASMCFGFCR